MPTVAKLSIDVLEHHLATLEQSLVFWTWVVVVGLIYEYMYEWYTHLANPLWRNPVPPIASSSAFPRTKLQYVEAAMPLSPVIAPTVIGLRKRFKPATRLEKLGGILVVLGVSGELYTEARLSITAQQLREADASIIGDLTTRLTQARSDADSARSIASATRQEAESFKERIALAESKLTEAMQLAKLAEDHTVEQRLREAPRMLNPARQAFVADRLRQFGSQWAEVIIIGDAEEISNLAGQIVNVLRQAGWSANVIGKAIAGPNTSGVLVGTHVGSNENVINAADALVRVLESVGIDARDFSPQFGNELPMPLNSNRDWDPKKPAPIRVLVGAKP